MANENFFSPNSPVNMDDADDVILLKNVCMAVIQTGTDVIISSEIDTAEYRLTIDVTLANKILRKLEGNNFEGYNVLKILSKIREEDKPTFKYVLHWVPDNKKKYIRKISFPIGYEEDNMHTIEFNDNITEKQAIEEAEKFLSEPITETYYNSNPLFQQQMRDNFKRNLTFEEIKDKKYIIKSDLATSRHMFLEGFTKKAGGEVIFNTGS